LKLEYLYFTKASIYFKFLFVCFHFQPIFLHSVRPTHLRLFLQPMAYNRFPILGGLFFTSNWDAMIFCNLNLEQHQPRTYSKICIYPIFVLNYCPFSLIFSMRFPLLITVFLLIFVDCLFDHQYPVRHILICLIGRSHLPASYRFPCHFNRIFSLILVPIDSFPFRQLPDLYFF